MLLFYDFETSSREFIGQILSYAFVITTPSLNIQSHIEGTIKLNRTQCPDVDAILTNKLNIEDLQEHGDTEFKAAHKIHAFISELINQYKTVTLIGFNSNSFDLNFLRNLFIRNGLNPYFKGALLNKDILHWSQYLAFYFPDTFPWVLQENNDKRYYSFKLEDLSNSCKLLSEGEDQTHNALDDVLLTIKLVQYFEHLFNENISNFQAYRIEKPTLSLPQKQRSRHFSNPDSSPSKFIYNYLYPLSLSGKSHLFINLPDDPLNISISSLSEDEKLSMISYKNVNKHFFITESCNTTELDSYKNIIQDIEKDAFFNSIKQQPTQYFELNKKDWDIEYQIHELGFQRIDSLKSLINTFTQDETQYPTLLNSLLEKREGKKDNYLIQLFNRFYLNNHSNPDKNLLNRYLHPRYITGILYRSNEYPNHFEQQFAYLETKLNEEQDDNNIEILTSLKRYYTKFKLQFNG